MNFNFFLLGLIMQGFMTTQEADYVYQNLKDLPMPKTITELYDDVMNRLNEYRDLVTKNED